MVIVSFWLVGWLVGCCVCIVVVLVEFYGNVLSPRKKKVVSNLVFRFVSYHIISIHLVFPVAMATDATTRVSFTTSKRGSWRKSMDRTTMSKGLSSSVVQKIQEDGKAKVQLAGREFTIKKQFIDDINEVDINISFVYIGWGCKNSQRKNEVSKA